MCFHERLLFPCSVTEKLEKKMFLKIKTTREVKFIVFYMSREFSGVSVEFGFVGDFLFPNGSLL